MKTSFSILLLTFCSVLMLLQCKSGNTVDSQENEQNQLAKTKSAIELLASKSECSGAYTCKFIALGSKPCGGPWEYLIYSTSIDTKKLEQIVKDYNDQEKAFNGKWDIISDCAITNPPSNLKCENNICIAVY